MLPNRKDRPFYVATKSSKRDPAAVRRDLETSLERMGLDQIDFFHVWCVMTPEEYELRKRNGVFDECLKLKDEKLIRHICISTHMNGDEIGGVLRDFPFSGVLMGHSVMNYAYREKAIETAHELGMGVVIMNPLGGGIIPQNPKIFDFVRSNQDETVVSGALRFLLSDTRITTALVGFSRLEHLSEAVEAVRNFQPLKPERVTEIREHLKRSFNGLCTNCRYCDSCPEGIPVPKLMEALNQYKITGKIAAGIDRMRYHWGLDVTVDYSAKCTKCGRCVRACTQKLDIVNQLESMAEKIRACLEEREKAKNAAAK
jgi:predicted aldo/keto reductase-like oxidoreductase